MSVPINLLRWAGDWKNIIYYQYDVVQSPIDLLDYVYVGIPPIIGGTDPSVQPNPVWVLLPPNPNSFSSVYGSFSSTQTQNVNPSFPALAPLPLVYDTKDIASSAGVNVLFPSSRIIVSNTGVYKVLASVQMNKTTGGNAEVDMYISISGTPVPNSATKLNINANEESVMTVEWFVPMTAGQFVEVVLYSTANGIQALAVPAAPPVPAIPSIITTILRIA